ncbi:MAG: transcriptional regulator [Bacteroidetes bacterium]|nr:transcriptional regulator [Bacteroidota bacterium]
MKKYFLLLNCIVIACKLCGQSALAIPEIINYPKQVYNAGTQSWDVKQDKNGILYFANNDGLLSFDGNYWKTYALPPARTHARCIEIAPDNRIYVGAQDDIGYFTPGANGRLVYTSLKHLLPATDQSVSEVWDAIYFNGDIFFRTDVKIMQYTKGGFVVHKPQSQWRFLGQSNNMLVAQDRKNGLFYFVNGQWQPLAAAGNFPPDFLVSAIVPFGKDSSLVVTTKSGFFILSNHQITPFTTPDLLQAADKLVFGACTIGSETVALATRLGGCFIINKNGTIINRFSIREGLQNSNVYNVFADRNNNLWLCLDNGIDFIAYNSAIKHIYPEVQNNGSGYASIIYKNTLYLGSSNGLFKSALKNTADLAAEVNAFEPVAKTGGQVWNLSVVNDNLLMGHHEGAFTITNNTAQLLSNWTGYWNFIPMSGIPPSPYIIAGNYRGVSFFKYENNQFKNIDSNLIIESSRFLTVLNDNKTVWIGHPYKGLYRLQWNDQNKIDIRHIGTNEFPLGVNKNYIFKVKGSIVLATGRGIYEYNSKSDSFQLSPFFNTILNGLPVSYLKEDPAGNIWFVTGANVGVIDMSGDKPKVIFIPELNHHIVSGFENINPVDTRNVLIGAEKGFFHINYEAYKNNINRNIQVHLSVVQSLGKKDSLLFGGYFSTISGNVQEKNLIPTVAYSNNSFHFEYSSTLYGQQANIEFSYYLKQFDKQWSDWQHKTEKDYTNLPAGSYTFMVKCRNGAGNESAITSYSFYVLPPWYQTWWAYLLYFILFAGCIYMWYLQQQKKFLRQQKEKLKQQQQQHQEEQRELQYQHNLELEKNEKEIIKLKNDNLQAQIEMKNAELAGNAMSLVQKSELLSRIKEQLLMMKNNSEQEKESKDLKKVITIINKELELNNDWDQFAVHFDEVHANFLTSLKKKYPSLTSSELKLCAYLRLNLTSKEIAQLMNISVRGVETSRYRVRKKLDVTAEQSLFDLLFSIDSNAEHKQPE